MPSEKNIFYNMKKRLKIYWQKRKNIYFCATLNADVA